MQELCEEGMGFERYLGMLAEVQRGVNLPPNRVPSSFLFAYVLRQALELARAQLGLGRVLVTCDDDNVGSIRTIEKNGGVLENVVAPPGHEKATRRYWISLEARERGDAV